MTRPRLILAAFGMLLAAPVAQAHPHVFVETGLKLVADDAGRLVGVEVSWTYDDFYSLLLLEDLGLDPDGDGTLSEEELAKLDGFDLQWIEGYLGDLYVTAGGDPVVLGSPEGRGTEVVAGRIVSRHYRSFAPQDGALIVKAYDPTFYTAYDLEGGVDVPDGCALVIQPADLDRAYTMVEEALYKNPAMPDDEFPEVGEAFADTVEVTCNG
ncbi:MAG: polyphosphate kinase [Rhodobacterales bacterium 34-62-10]|nr:MAG: polyphosphate kinase [Rhodobacterales bacterium 34-62-10]